MARIIFKYDDIVTLHTILLGDYPIHRKYASMLLIKIILGTNGLKELLNDKDYYPFDRKDYRVRKWANSVTSGACERCGSSERLEAHHIIKWADYPQGRIDLNNGECLCHDCHTKEHINDASYNLMVAT